MKELSSGLVLKRGCPISEMLGVTSFGIELLHVSQFLFAYNDFLWGYDPYLNINVPHTPSTEACRHQDFD